MNLPTKLTIFRILIVPFLWWVLLTSFFNSHIKLWIAFVLFVVASITDYLDGYIARKYNLITDLGKFLDPIADKILVNSLLVYLAYVNRINILFVLLMLTRDTLVDALRMFASSKKVVIAAALSGKLKTVLQMVAISMALISVISQSVVNGMMLIATVVSVLSGIQYFINSKAIFNDNKK